MKNIDYKNLWRSLKNRLWEYYDKSVECEEEGLIDESDEYARSIEDVKQKLLQRIIRDMKEIEEDERYKTI